MHFESMRFDAPSNCSAMAHANDLPMLQAAGMGVAFKAKPFVRVSAQYAISHSGLDGILYLMGYSDRDLQALGSV